MSDDDFFEDDAAEVAADRPTVAMLVVDDEPGVHEVTRLALSGFAFQGCGLELISAFSAAQARAVLAARDDIAVMLLDVVMESESAGLDLVHEIRRELGNVDIRIILRTGQPGQAPEERVIADYDINDYKAKAELTRAHLLTSVIGALRSWRDIQDLHRYRREAYALAGRQAALLEAALELVAAPAAVLDGDGLIMAANAAFAARAGRPADALAGLDLAGAGLAELADSLAIPADGSGAPTVAGAVLKSVPAPDGRVEAWLLRLDRG